MKTKYLADADVVAFVQWLGANLDNATFAHSYKNRKTGNPWSCSGLSDAFTNYHWPHRAIPRLDVLAGASSATNAAALVALQNDLRNALAPSPSGFAACLAAIDVMRWGGVVWGNVSWLLANQKGLAQLLIDTRKALNAGNTKHRVLTAKTLRFNAGMTKVYSLICDDLIIYDSRVAAALGWAVVKFCRATERTVVPAELLFPWAPANEGKSQLAPKRRDPSDGPFKFPRLHSGPKHAEWNVKASWVLEATLNHANAAGSSFKKVGGPGGPLRALEAALFMIGYDLPPQPPSTQQTTLDSDEWTECHTKKRLNPFHYRITGNGIEVKGGPTFSDADINATLQPLWHHFGKKPFPLANSATAVRNGSAKMGLGKAYFDATRKNPPDTSKLAAVLEELGVIDRVVPSPAKGLHWTLNAGLLGLMAPGASVNIRPVLDDAVAAQDEL